MRLVSTAVMFRSRFMRMLLSRELQLFAEQRVVVKWAKIFEKCYAPLKHTILNLYTRHVFY